MILVGFNQASASPTFSQICFDSETDAQEHKKHYEFRKIDNSDIVEKDNRASIYYSKDNVDFAELKNILGESQLILDSDRNVEIHEWTLMISGSPTSSPIQYDKANGYCLSTRMGGTRIITYKWTSEIYDKTRGSVTRYELYI